MHLGKTLLGHMKDCLKCQNRYAYITDLPNRAVSVSITAADKEYQEKNGELYEPKATQ